MRCNEKKPFEIPKKDFLIIDPLKVNIFQFEIIAAFQRW